MNGYEDTECEKYFTPPETDKELVEKMELNELVKAVPMSVGQQARLLKELEDIIAKARKAEREKWLKLGWKILPMLKGVQARQKSEGVTWETSLDAVIIELTKTLKGEDNAD